MSSSPSVTADLERHLFLDDRLIAETHNAKLTVGTVAKHAGNPLFGEEQPWEARFDNLYANVLYDQLHGYRCWYNPFIVDPQGSVTPRHERHKVTYKARPGESGICYAVSQDGIVWSKPDLDLVSFNGSTANNLVLRGIHGAGIFKDQRDPKPERRYKMFYGGKWIKEWEPGIAVQFSEDGLHWSDAVACPQVEAAGDTHNSPLWVPQLEKYVAMTRIHRGEPFELHPDGQRAVGRTESQDFVHWTAATEALRGEPQNQTYAMLVFPTAGLYLALLMIIRLKEDRVHCELAWSPDTVDWHRVDPGTPLVPNSETEGDYDWGCVYGANAPIATKESIWIYYGGSNGRHRSWRDSFLCLATLRPDGWAGYEPVNARKTAVVVTRPRACRGQVHLTADAAGGLVQINALDDDGTVLAEGQPIAEDVTDRRVQWANPDQETACAGRSVRLSFRIQRAKVYSVRV